MSVCRAHVPKHVFRFLEHALDAEVSQGTASAGPTEARAPLGVGHQPFHAAAAPMPSASIRAASRSRCDPLPTMSGLQLGNRGSNR